MFKLLRRIFFFNDTATTEIYTLSLHDALPISNVPAGALIDTSCAMTALPSGSVSSLEPVSKSSQSPFPRIASHDATSARLSSTFRNTSWALRTMTVSGASAITVLSPAAVTLGAGAGAPLENAALGPGDAALRAVSEKLTEPIVPLEQAATTSADTSAKIFTICIVPPGIGLKVTVNSRHTWASDVPRCRRAPTAAREHDA